MAKRSKKDEPEKRESPKKALLTRIRKRYTVMVKADRDNRQKGIEDIKFVNVPGEQWDANMKKERGTRPCYEFNKLRTKSKRIINEMRANRPAGKVRGVEGGDKKTAEIYEGHIRNIWNVSDGDTVIDYAGEYQVNGGMGSWRVNTKYAYDDAFDQDIVIEPLQNPFNLYWDPACKDMLKRDAMDCILTDRISKTAFDERYPKAERIDWEASEFDDDSDWEDEETVRICEYWYKELVYKELWQLQDGKVIDAASDEAPLIDPALIKNKRQAKCYKVKMCIASGDAILEESEWAGSQLPFITVYGEYIVIEGKVQWCGLPRFTKDAQRSYNISRTSIDETIAQAPQAKYWATVKQAKGNTEKWAEAHQKNFPFLLYNADPEANGPPQRMGAADVPVALIQQSQLASEELDSLAGFIFDPTSGENSNASGKALNARARAGQITNYNYQDNMGKGVRRTWEILIDLIPKIYDTERELRILGSDGAEDYVKVNEVVMDPQSGKAIKVNDLAQGKYDVTVTVGPSFATQRQEASEMYTQLAQSDEMLMPTAGDLVYKSLDLPYAEEIAERRRAMLPPQIQQMLTQGKSIPPEAQAALTQASQAMQIVEQKNQLVMQAAQELQQEQQGVEKGKSELDMKLAQLETKKAQFDAHVAKQMAALTQAQAQLQVGDANLKANTAQAAAKTQEDGNAGEREQLGNQVAEALQTINEMAQQFAVAASQVLAQIQAKAQEQPPPKPRLKAMKARRVNGELIAEPIYEEQEALPV